MQAHNGFRQERVANGVAVIHPGRTRQLAHTDGRLVGHAQTMQTTARHHAPHLGARRASGNAVTRARLGRAARPQTGAAYG